MSLNSFQQISEENFQKLEAYLQNIREGALKLPSRGGKVNKTAVATACGFNRETFTQNKRFEDRLDQAVTELGLERPTAPEEPPRRDGADKARITQLELQLAAVRGENYELRRKLARYEHSTVTGRRVIP